MLVLLSVVALSVVVVLLLPASHCCAVVCCSLTISSSSSSPSLPQVRRLQGDSFSVGTGGIAVIVPAPQSSHNAVLYQSANPPPSGSAAARAELAEDALVWARRGDGGVWWPGTVTARTAVGREVRWFGLQGGGDGCVQVIENRAVALYRGQDEQKEAAMLGSGFDDNSCSLAIGEVQLDFMSRQAAGAEQGFEGHAEEELLAAQQAGGGGFASPVMRTPSAKGGGGGSGSMPPASPFRSPNAARVLCSLQSPTQGGGLTSPVERNRPVVASVAAAHASPPSLHARPMFQSRTVKIEWKVIACLRACSAAASELRAPRTHFVSLQELPYDEAAEAEESSEGEGEESMATSRFTKSLRRQGGGSLESSSSHEIHGIIGQINEMLTLKLSSCPHLDNEFSLTYKHLDDLSREEISQLLGEARVQAKKCSQSKYCEMLMAALGLSPDEVLTQSFPDRGEEWSVDGVDSVHCNVCDSDHNCGPGEDAPARTLKTFAHHLDSQKHTQKKSSQQHGGRPRPPGAAHRRPPSAASIAGAGASHPSSISFGKGGAQSRSKGRSGRIGSRSNPGSSKQKQLFGSSSAKPRAARGRGGKKRKAAAPAVQPTAHDDDHIPLPMQTTMEAGRKPGVKKGRNNGTPDRACCCSAQRPR